MLITETNAQGNLIKDYIWQEGMMPVAQVDNTQDTKSIIYLYTDHLMTNRLATDDNQQVVWRWEGEAFGNTPAEELGGVSINLRFPGQYYDSETNLHYNWNRYYDPQLGRYITSDPIGVDGGMNSYSYASMNSINQFDFYGLRASRSLRMGFDIITSAADYRSQKGADEAREYRLKRKIEGLREKIEYIIDQINAYAEALDFATDKVLFCRKEGNRRYQADKCFNLVKWLKNCEKVYDYSLREHAKWKRIYEIKRQEARDELRFLEAIR